MTNHFRTYIYIWIIFLLTACSKDEEPVNLPPSVSIEAARDITRTSALLSGKVTPNAEGNVSQIRFRYGLTSDMTESVDISVTEEQDVSTLLTGLHPGSTYYYRLEAGNTYSTVHSETMSFETVPNTEPTVSDLKMLNQGPSSITLECEILDDGGEEITATGFYFRAEEDEQEQQIKLGSPEEKRWKTRIGNLQLETTYYIQAYAANSIGETRSKVYQFQTGEVVVLTEAGTLHEAIGEQEKYQFTTLSIAGPLNGTDIRYLRDMMGTDIEGENTDGRLQRLNLNDASIVAGGASYDGQRFTTANTVSQGMFANCIWLQELTLPVGVTTVERNAFENCTSLSVLHFSPLLARFASSEGCSSLTILDIPEVNPAFSSDNGILYNQKMTELVWYPEGKKEEYFQIPSNITTIREYAFYNTRLQQIDLPSSVKEIGQEAFAFSAIKSIVLPDNISLIPHGCFQQCRQLQSLTLGASVSYLSEYCFDGCSSLQHLYIKASDFPPVCQDETFVGAEQLFEQGTLHVPYGCQSIYRKHAVWGQFRNIVEESF